MTAYIIRIAIAFAGCIGLSIVFGVRRKYWLIIAADAALSCTIYLIFNMMIGNFFASLISAFFCSLYAHIAARVVRAPTTVLLMAAATPMMPGSDLYYTASYGLAHDLVNFKIYGMQTAETIFGLAIGFALVTWLFRLLGRKKTNPSYT